MAISGATYRDGVAYIEGAMVVTPAPGSSWANPTFTGQVNGGSIILGQSWAGITGAADTNENALATVNVPVLGANAVLRIRAIWSCTNNANVKTIRIKFSGAAGTAYLALPVTSTTGVMTETIIANRGATNSQVGTQATAVSFNAGTAITSSVDTSVATTLVFTVQKATGTDTMKLEGYIVELLNP